MRDEQPVPAAPAQSRGGRLGFAVTACLASAALLAPIAIGATGSPLREGERNPSSGAAASRETLIIASTPPNVYGTRQSNLGAGGAAIYGCRTSADRQDLGDPAKSTPCLRVNNLSTGLVFNYRFARGGVGGVYQAGATTANDLVARPFITNATAIATGLNADRVDGVEPSVIVATIRATGLGPQGPKGLPGDKGAAGAPGPAGIAGARGQWFRGTDPPPGNLPGSLPGDFYLDLADPGRGDVYIKTSLGTWSQSPDGPNIAGPPGEPVTPVSQFQPAVDAFVRDYCQQPATTAC